MPPKNRQVPILAMISGGARKSPSVGTKPVIAPRIIAAMKIMTLPMKIGIHRGVDDIVICPIYSIEKQQILSMSSELEQARLDLTMKKPGAEITGSIPICLSRGVRSIKMLCGF